MTAFPRLGVSALVGVAILALSFASGAPSDLVVDGDKIVAQLTKLALFSDDTDARDGMTAVTRVLFTATDMEARGYTKQLMTAAGLTIREDALGNIYGRLAGSDPKAGSVLTGSHNDAIPLAGMYDGTVGVIAAIEALAALQAAGYKPKRPLEVLMFTSEEPTRFALSCVGSRAMAGTLSPEYLKSKLDVNGTDFLTAANAVGYGGKSYEAILKDALVPKGQVDFFVELHIEQGPELEAQGLDIGIVSAIAAPAALSVEFHGDGGHAGAQLMPLRNDAGLAAAELALAVEAATLATEDPNSVGTTGKVLISPGAVNSVPRDAVLGIDIRDTDGARRDTIVAKVLAAAAEIAARRNVRHSVSIVNQDPPAACSDEVQAAAKRASDSLGLKSRSMVSRAYHDSLFMARIAPTAMIFIPCRNGWSHRPDEFSTPEAIAAGAHVLALTIADLSGGIWGAPPAAGVVKSEL
ncbi:hypothetical protein FOA52_009830 [Chlamydomonas sp. UWO 241]|nr:hypothetical protein FOA52_009830 [Chlamydomonas sp. UWO 241]